MNYARAELELEADADTGRIDVVYPGAIAAGHPGAQWRAAEALVRMSRRLTGSARIQHGPRVCYRRPGFNPAQRTAKPGRARVFIFFDACAASPTP